MQFQRTEESIAKQNCKKKVQGGCCQPSHLRHTGGTPLSLTVACWNKETERSHLGPAVPQKTIFKLDVIRWRENGGVMSSLNLSTVFVEEHYLQKYERIYERAGTVTKTGCTNGSLILRFCGEKVKTLYIQRQKPTQFCLQNWLQSWPFYVSTVIYPNDCIFNQNSD